MLSYDFISVIKNYQRLGRVDHSLLEMQEFIFVFNKAEREKNSDSI